MADLSLVPEIDRLLTEAGSCVVPMRWSHGRFYLLDQRLLPQKKIWLSYDSCEQVAKAINDMVVRGAPAIGITAAFGMVLAAQELEGTSSKEFKDAFEQKAAKLKAARPTAVNLCWAVEHMKGLVKEDMSQKQAALILEREALSIWKADVEANLAMAQFGQALLPDEAGILTHCNAGALATGGYGTALGVIRAAVKAGKKISVHADETRPWFQGARLTVFELMMDQIPVVLNIDSAAGILMKQGHVQAVIVGADRIAANGDVANKIGTYSLALIAKAHEIPFYVAAPTTTLDPNTTTGDQIPIEQRSASEITHVAGYAVSPAGSLALNPVFDITPSELITAIITERGVLTPPYESAIQKCLS